MGNGTVYRRGNIWWIKYHVNGKAFYETSGSADKYVAQRLLRKRLGDIDMGLPVNPQAQKLTFDDAVQAVVDDYKVNDQRSLGHIERRIRLHLKPFFTGRRLSSITFAHVNQYIVKRKQDEASNASINRELAIIRRAFRLAKKAGHLMFVPEIEMLRENNARKGFFDPDRFETVRNHLPEEVRGLVTFAYITGWRVPSEVQTLTWSLVDFKASEVRLDPGTTKNDEARVFPFTAELRAVLEAQRAYTDAVQRKRGMIIPWVFHRKGTPIHYFRRSWLTACKKAGCPGMIRHDFRRTAVRNLVRAGVPERVAMMMTGHKTRAVFERYNIVNEADLREAARKLDEATVTLSLQRGAAAPGDAAACTANPLN